MLFSSSLKLRARIVIQTRHSESKIYRKHEKKKKNRYIEIIEIWVKNHKKFNKVERFRNFNLCSALFLRISVNFQQLFDDS